jgi:hypothetical protein
MKLLNIGDNFLVNDGFDRVAKKVVTSIQYRNGEYWYGVKGEVRKYSPSMVVKKDKNSKSK